MKKFFYKVLEVYNILTFVIGAMVGVYLICGFLSLAFKPKMCKVSINHKGSVKTFSKAQDCSCYRGICTFFADGAWYRNVEGIIIK